jgi:hypothetical protein
MSSKVATKKISKQNQLHEVTTYNVENMFFGEPEAYSIPGPAPINFHRMNIYTKNQNEDGTTSNTVGDLILKFEKMFCFGVSENKSQDGGNVTSHSVSCCMWSREGATENELKATELLECIIQKCKERIISVKKELKKPKMEMSDLKKLDKLLYWKEDENGDRVPGVGPIFTPKLLEYKETKDKNGNVKPHQIATIFYLENEFDEEGNPQVVSPLEFLSDKTNKKYCSITPAIKIDNIFIGGTAITIQCKILEADISVNQSRQQSLLHPNMTITNKKPVVQTPEEKVSNDINEDDDEDSENEL